MDRLRAILILILFLALTLPLMPLQYFLQSRRLPWIYHRILCRILGMAITIEGALPAAPALIVSNHMSWLDIPLLGAVLPVSFIAKREVSSWPLFGAMAKLQRTVFIDRERRTSTHKKRDELSQRLQAGETLVLFPEGTSSDGTTVLPFKSSYFGAVESLETPVVPVTICYLGVPKFYAWHGEMDLLPHLWAVVKSGPIKAHVTFHSPIVKADRKSMAANAEQIVRATLGESAQIR